MFWIYICFVGDPMWFDNGHDFIQQTLVIFFMSSQPICKSVGLLHIFSKRNYLAETFLDLYSFRTANNVIEDQFNSGLLRI